MRIMAQEGLTLVELLMAIAIFGLIAAGASTLLSASLEIQDQGEASYKLYQEGLIIMERLTSEVKTTTLLHIPNAHPNKQAFPRDILAFSANTNDDSDNYFNDDLFPRIDEDPDNILFTDGYGIPGLDDDGDGSIDEIGTGKDDTDEDGAPNEETLDGIDNDDDGNIDEDLGKDSNKDSKSGISGMDDNNNGQVDEENAEDDDEDGTRNEDSPNLILYCFGANDTCQGNTTLYKVTPDSNDGMTSATYTPISERVTKFQTTYLLDTDTILIELTLMAADGETVEFSEYVCPRNRLQKTGKRVR